MYQDKRKEQADKMNYFDCHVDTLTEILKPGDTLDENSCDLDLKRVGNFVENYTQIFAIWKDAVKLDKEEPDRDFFRLYDRAMAYLAEENPDLRLLRRHIHFHNSRSALRSEIPFPGSFLHIYP